MYIQYINKKNNKDGNDSFEHKEEIQVIFRKPFDLLISSILNNYYYFY